MFEQVRRGCSRRATHQIVMTMRVAFLFLVASTAAFEASDMTKDASTNRHSHSPVAKPKTGENDAKEENKTEKDEVQEGRKLYHWGCGDWGAHPCHRHHPHHPHTPHTHYPPPPAPYVTPPPAPPGQPYENMCTTSHTQCRDNGNDCCEAPGSQGCASYNFLKVRTRVPGYEFRTQVSSYGPCPDEAQYACCDFGTCPEPLPERCAARVHACAPAPPRSKK